MNDDLVTWLRRAVEARLFLARHTIELGNAAEWHEQSSGVLMTCRPDAPQDNWDGVWAMGDSTLTRLMEANDPQDTIARCEAELAILDEHSWLPDGTCRSCILMHDGPYRPACPCKPLYLLAAGYRHWPGYQEGWKP